MVIPGRAGRDHNHGKGKRLTENLVAAAAFYAAIGLHKGTDWTITRRSDGTPVARCLTPEAFARAHNAMNAAVGIMSGGWWEPA